MVDSIVFLGTGGTIAGSASSAQDNLSYTSGRVPLGDLLAALPGLPERLGGHAMLHEQVFQEDSKDLDPGHAGGERVLFGPQLAGQFVGCKTGGDNLRHAPGDFSVAGRPPKLA